MPLSLKTLVCIPQESDINLTPCLRLATALEWGVIILCHRCPRTCIWCTQGHTTGSDCPEAHATTSVFPWATDNTLPSVYLPITFPGKKSLFIPLPKGLMKRNRTCKIFQVAIIKFYWSIYYLSWSFCFLQTFFQLEFLRSFFPYSFCQ